MRTGAVIDLLVLFVGSLNNSTGGGVPAAVTLVVFGVSLLHRARKYWHEECYSHAFEATGHKLGELGNLCVAHRPEPQRPQDIRFVVPDSTCSLFCDSGR